MTTNSTTYNTSNNSATTTSTAAVSNNFFTRAQKVAFQTFEGKDYPERKSLNKALAGDILKTTKHLKSDVNWRQFALAHCPGIIRHTSLEGGSSPISVAASLKYIDSCSNAQNGLFFSIDSFAEETLNKLKRSLVDYSKFMDLTPPQTDETTPDVELMKSVNAYLDTIEHHPNLSTSGVYLPLGYRHGTANQGHAIPCKLVEKGDEIVVSIFNVGNGSEPHPTVGYTLDQRKPSFTCKPIAIPKKVFFGPLGEKAFSQLLRYQSDAPLKDGEPYDGKDVYDIFFQFLSSPETGRLLEIDCPEEYATDIQISCNCPELAIRYMLTDVMIQEKIPFSDREKLFLNRDFASLMAHYHAFIENPSCHVSARELLLNAANRFGAQLGRLYDEKKIKEEEFIGATAVIHEIETAVNKTPYPVKAAKSAVAPLANFNRHFETVSELKNYIPLAKARAQKVYKPKKFEAPKFQSMKTLNADLKKWIETTKTLPRGIVFDYVSDCMRQLPIPTTRDSKNKEDLWNELPQADVTDTLNLIEELLKIGLQREKVEPYDNSEHKVGNNHFFEQFLMIYSAYSIADKLARLCEEETKLSGYSCPFFPMPFSFTPRGFTSIPLKEDNERFSAIYEYMTKESAKFLGKNVDKPIFPIAPILEMKQFVHPLLSGGSTKETIQGTCHVQYLCQFLPISSNDDEQTLALNVAKNWMSSLPSKVRTLYYFSFLSNVLFSTPGKSFPLSLQFSDGPDKENPSLQIENLFFQPEPEKDPFWPVDKDITLFGEDHKPKAEEPLVDRRFESAFLRPTSKRSFANLNSPEFKDLKTNEAISFILSEKKQEEWKIDESDFRTLLYDTRRGNLSLWQVLQDFSSIENHHLLSHEWVQQVLESCFFQPHHLLERLKEEPENVSLAFREFVRNGLANYNDNPAQSQAILFLVRMGVTFESYAQPSVKGDEALNLYHTTLHKLSNNLVSMKSLEGTRKAKTNLDTLMLLLDFVSEKKLPEKLLVSFFHHNVYSGSEGHATWIAPYLPRMIRKTASKCSDLLLDPLKRNVICNQILETIIPDKEILGELDSTGWEGDFPEYTCGDFVLNFFSGTIKSKTYKGVLKKYTRYEHDAARDYFTGKHGKLFWTRKAGQGLISLDGKLEFHAEQERWKEIVPNTDGSFGEGEQISFARWHETDSLSQGFLSHVSYFPYVHLKQKDGSVISYDTKTKEPRLLMENQGGHSVYRRLDKNGNKLPFVLAELSKLGPSDPLYRYTTRFVASNDVACFIDETSKEIHELDFFKLKLKFTHDGKGLAWTKDEKFYFIADEKDLGSAEEKEAYARLREEINQFDGAITLYNRADKKWNVFFPNHTFTKIADPGEDFSRDVQAVTDGFSWTSGYFHFEFDPIERNLKSLSADSTHSNAYLAVLFKMQKSYEKAFKYLKKVKTSSFFDRGLIGILDKLTKMTDCEPASLAFNLKFSLFAFRNKDLMLEKQFHSRDRKNRDFYGDFLQWSIQNYKLYCTESCSVCTPEKLRLSDPEKMMLLFAFRRSYQDMPCRKNEKHLTWEERWKREQPLLDKQYSVLFSSQLENTWIPEEQELRVSPPILTSLQLPNSPCFSLNFSSSTHSNSLIDFILETYHGQKKFEIPTSAVRLSAQAIAAHFVEFYDQAKSCLPGVVSDFDFTLQTLLKANKKSAHTNYPLGDLLYWIRHFPDAFKDLSLSSPPTKHALEQIFERVCRIPENYPYRYAKLKEARKAMTTFKIDKPILLSAKKEALQNMKVKVANVSAPPPDLNTYLTATENQIYRLFNSPYKVKGGALSAAEVEQEMRFKLGKDSAQTLAFPKTANSRPGSGAECLPEVLMKQVILKNNLRYLCKHRPMLTEDQMNELCRLNNEWYHTRVLLKLKEDGKEHLYLPYDYQKYPEISYLYLKTSKFPRQGQLDVHLWNMANLEKGINGHFQLGAGEGKTDVITPLLILGAKRFGLLPVTCVTQAIYPVDKENLSYNLGALDEDLYFLEVGMHMINQLSSLDLEFIYAQLMQYKSSSKSLLITRHTYDALRLIRDLALKNGYELHTKDRDKIHKADAFLKALESFFRKTNSEDSLYPALLTKLREGIQQFLKDVENYQTLGKEIGRKFRYAQNILNFFEESCLFICDESHQNADARTKAIYGVGELAQILEKESRHMLAMMKPALASSLKSPTQEEIASFRGSLAKQYLGLIPQIPSTAYLEIVQFWTDTNAKQPAILKSLAEKKETKEIANLISITKHFLIDLLPEVLTECTDIDHARSLYPQRKYEVPARNKVVSTSEYSGKYRTCAMTIKGNHQRGLYEDDIRHLLTHMLKNLDNEKKQGFLNAPSNLLFKKWMDRTSLKGQNPLKIEDVQLSDATMMKALHDNLSKQSDVIDYFLTEIAIIGIGTPTQELSCTTTDDFNGFRHHVSFSATPREDLANPRSIKAYYRDLKFERNVKENWKEAQNSTILYAEDEEDFFNQMKDGQHLQETVLIDPRGFFISPSASLAKKWLDLNPKLDGVLYFKQGRSTDVDRDEKICYLSRDGKLLELKGSKVELALKEHGLDWEALNIGTIYGPSQSESAHITQKKGAKACFFAGDELTTPHAVQARMRCRGALNLGQTVTTFFTKALGRKVFHQKTPSIDAMFDWTDENQKVQEEKRIILNAFQEIHFAIAKEARAKIKKAHASDKSAEMFQAFGVYEQHERGLVDNNLTEAFDIHGEHPVMKNTRFELERYARATYEKFAYETSLEDNRAVKDEIESIIALMEKRIKEISTRYLELSLSEIDQHLELDTDVHRDQHKIVPRHADPLALDGMYGDIAIYSPQILEAKGPLARDFFKTKFLSDHLYLSHNHLRTAKLRDDSDPSSQYFKPIHYALIFDAPGEVFANVQSNEILETDQKQLMCCPEKVEGLKHTAFLVMANGMRAQKGKGAIASSPDKMAEIMNSTWYSDVMLDIALLNGKITNPDALIQRIKKTGWKEFDALWTRIKQGLPCPAKAHTQAFDQLKERYAKEFGPDSLNT